jgi:hypothetical protein
MPIVPLGVGAYKRANGFTPEVELLNLYLEPDKSGVSPDKFQRIQRPGLSLVGTMPGTSQAIFQQDGVLSGSVFGIASATLYAVTASPTALGSAGPGAGYGAMCATKFGLFTLLGGVLKVWDGATYTAIAIPVGYTAVGIDAINNFVIVAMSSGRFYWIQPGAVVIDLLDFATAESSPDGLVTVCRVGSEFWLFGGTSIEPWQPTGDSDAPFQLASGRVYSRGCASGASVRRFDNSVIWVGEDGNTYRGDSTPTRISDHGVDERVRRAGAANTSAFTLDADGHKFYALRIGTEATMMFDASTQEWCRASSAGYDYWRPAFSPPDQSGYVADSESGAVWAVDPATATDAGEAFTRRVTGTVPIMGAPPRNDSFSIGMSASADCTVKLRWRDGQDDYPAFAEELDMRAPLDVVTCYRLGQPDQPYRTFEVTVDDPVIIRIAGAKANEGYR